MKCIKYVLFIFNLIFFLAGLILIVAGALVQTKFQSYFAFFGDQFNGAAILLIVVGVIVFTVAFFGCCGAYKENHCMIMAFAVLLGIVFILEIAAAIAAHLLQSQLKDLVRKGMNDAIESYPNEGIKKAWDETQKTLKCCGSSNYTDWSRNEFLAHNSSVPDSCCYEISDQCGLAALKKPEPDVYHQGCADAIITGAEKNMMIIIGVAVGLAIIQIVGIIIACLLAAAIRKDYTPM